MEPTAIAARALTKRFRIGRRGSRSEAVVRAVDGVTFELPVGTTLGVVGESGCGKSTLGRLLTGSLLPTDGAVEVEGRSLSGAKAIRTHLRGTVQLVAQDPASALDPRMRVGTSIAEPLREGSRDQRRERVAQMLERVGLQPEMARKRPHELSGGQQQRVCIARALIGGHKIVVLDEVVSALDSLARGRILELLVELQREYELSYLFISHDLPAVERVSTTVAVMYLGEIVEMAPVERFRRDLLLHPYSVALLSSRLDPGAGANAAPVILSGDVPSPVNRPAGCPFHPRCPIAQDQCRESKPPLQRFAGDHWAACHLPGRL